MRTPIPFSGTSLATLMACVVGVAVVATSGDALAQVTATDGGEVSPLADPSEPPDPESGVFFGARMGGFYPVMSAGLGRISGGLEVGLEFNYRFNRHLYAGLVADRGSMSVSTAGLDPDNLIPVSGYTMKFGAAVGVLTNPDGFGGLFQAGLGVRNVTLSLSDGSDVLSSGLFGPEATVGAGLWISVGDHLRLVPRLDVSLGLLSGDQATGGGGYAMFAFMLGVYPSFALH